MSFAEVSTIRSYFEKRALHKSNTCLKSEPGINCLLSKNVLIYTKKIGILKHLCHNRYQSSVIINDLF